MLKEYFKEALEFSQPPNPLIKALLWNGRKILVWNMEDAQNGMEDLKNGMEDHLPYLPNSKLHI